MNSLKQTNRQNTSMRIDREIDGIELRVQESTHIFMVNWFQHGYEHTSMQQVESFQEKVLGQLDIHMQKNEFEFLSHTIIKINSK